MSVIMEENSHANLGAPVGHMDITPELRREAEEMVSFSFRDRRH